jgi:hypothetical protein
LVWLDTALTVGKSAMMLPDNSINIHHGNRSAHDPVTLNAFLKNSAQG